MLVKRNLILPYAVCLSYRMYWACRRMTRAHPRLETLRTYRRHEPEDQTTPVTKGRFVQLREGLGLLLLDLVWA